MGARMEMAGWFTLSLASRQGPGTQPPSLRSAFSSMTKDRALAGRLVKALKRGGLKSLPKTFMVKAKTLQAGLSRLKTLMFISVFVAHKPFLACFGSQIRYEVC